MKKNNKGFVVSAVLYPLLVLFLALIMGLLAMTDTRKRILDKMKLEISDSIFDEATCSCDTILNKLNYLIKNGVGGGGGGSYTYNVLGLNVKNYEDPSSMPNVGNGIGDIAVITDTEISNYYVSSKVPESPKVGTVWIVQDKTSNYYVTSDYSKIGISYAMQYICDEAQTNCEWQIKKAYVYDDAKWNLLYYVPVKDGIIDLTSSDINAEITHTYDYTGEYQTFTARFSGYYKVELWGAQGGTANTTYGLGGKGAYTSGEIYLDAGEMLYIYVGGTTTSTSGGWNGGGDGYNGSYTGRGGGGATDVRLVPTTEKNIWNEFDSLKSRIMVAAGGGGGTYYANTYYGHGGAGGSLAGYNASANFGNIGTGATQSMGGYRNNYGDQLVGGFGYGSPSGTNSEGNGGGGGGYYGGGGGYDIAAGGGGSSYISGYEGCNSIEEESISTNIIHNGSAYHYSGYYFVNNAIISANASNMPNYDGNSTITGNTGGGYAKVTLKSIEVLEKSDLKELNSQEKTVWSYTYSGTNLYSGTYQIFKPAKSGIYKIQAWGAQGKTSSSSNGIGGKGAYTAGNIYLEAGEQLYIYVGGTTLSITGGWNGGGNGYNGSYTGGGGGGATDIRLMPTSSTHTWNEFESLKTRIMVAGGGGGGTYFSGGYYGHGGDGGSLAGYNASANFGNIGTGATQSMGGYRNNYGDQLVGGFGYGSPSGTNSEGNGGGGGGYYGGGGGYDIAAGGGGSSYISGYEGCNSIEEESTANNIIHNGSAYHYSGYYFEDMSMKSGKDSTVPTYVGDSMMTGNSGNGYARITFIKSENKTVDEIEKQKSNNLVNWHYEYSGLNLYVGRYQLFKVVKSGNYKVELWGAQGKTSNSSNGIGGKGAYTYGEIYLGSGEILYLFVGAQGYGTIGGWNGGGNGYNGSYTGGGGGGATDMRIVGTTSSNIWNEIASLKSRIMVAAGGGGGTYYNGSYYGHGGSGGGLIGYNASANYGNIGTGATQTMGGYRNGYPNLLVGGFGYGSASGTNSEGNGGGGSGWYGGGGGYDIAAGGGGSSYISGHAGCIAVTEDVLPKVETYTTLADSISYTGYKFTNTQMIDGNGYPWTTEKSSASSGMPSPTSSSLMTGNTGNGYARITYLGA